MLGRPMKTKQGLSKLAFLTIGPSHASSEGHVAESEYAAV